MTGQNTVSGQQLQSFVDRLERLAEEKSAISADSKTVMAEAESAGFTPKIIKRILKIRKMKPHDRHEWDALTDMYLHALGMAPDLPLFRAAGTAGFDATAREMVIEKMKDFVPASGMGHITVNMGGKNWQLTRDDDGNVTVREQVDAPPEPKTTMAPSGRVKSDPPPDVDEAGAEALGREFAKDNRPVIDNPFPFGDPRRPKFDAGWRSEAGSDGMGPDEDD